MIRTIAQRAVPGLAVAGLLAFAAVHPAAHYGLPGLPLRGAVSAAAVPASFAPASASFVSARSGYVLGSVGCRPRRACAARLAVTADGGRRWSFTGAPDVRVGGAVSSVVFASAADGWLYGPGLRYTRDGGARWRTVSLGGAVEQVAASAGRVYAVVAPPGGKPEELFASPAGRDAWARAGRFTAARAILAVSGRAAWFASASTVGTGSTHVWATDDGARWQRYPLRCPDSGHGRAKIAYGLTGMAAASAARVAFLCSGGAGLGSEPKEVLTSSDGGQIVHLAGQAPSAGDAVGIAVPPGRPQVITLAANSGASFLDRSADGGKTWTELQIPGTGGGPGLSSLSYPSPAVGWVVVGNPGEGSENWLLRTSDAGLSWHKISF